MKNRNISETTIGVVVLNYLNYQDTLECVGSLLKQSYKDLYIAVVDNHSANESYEVLKDRLSGFDNISVIQTHENLGFARGNNVGIAFLKEIGIRRILVSNSDVIFSDEDYFSVLAGIRYDMNVGMIGTVIINADGGSHNPVPVSGLTYLKFKRLEVISRVKKILVRYFPRVRLLRKLKSTFAVQSEENDYTKGHVRILDPKQEMLHGSVIYFTENFLDKYDGFYSGTFLFLEEDILNLLCQRTGMRQMYVPSIVVQHKEDGSSDMAWYHQDKKRIKEHYLEQSFRRLDSLRRKSNNELVQCFIHQISE